jgi:hypothetical protein
MRLTITTTNLFRELTPVRVAAREERDWITRCSTTLDESV